jgi:hypothetical protein
VIAKRGLQISDARSLRPSPADTTSRFRGFIDLRDVGRMAKSHQIQRLPSRWSLPAGSVQGLDLTPFARRDAFVLRGVEWALVVAVVVVGLPATSWRNRLLIMAVGSIAALVSYVAVFASLYAG